MSKSAQFPLHMWLPDSLYAPTPVHALLHAGIINAGGFLLCRLSPLFALSPATLHWVFAVGLLTALLGSSMMLVQNDIKKTLGYSTIGQMGFMIMECGLGAYGLAIFHFIAHGLFKGSIFLNCGYVIHAARQEPRLPPTRCRLRIAVSFPTLTWLTGLTTTLILPLIIVLAAHGILNIPLRDSQGTAIFLFFGWATSSQAILTLYRLRAVASWKVAVTMLATLIRRGYNLSVGGGKFHPLSVSRPGRSDLPLSGWRHCRSGCSIFWSLRSRLPLSSSWVLIYAGKPWTKHSHAGMGRRAASADLSAIDEPPLSRCLVHETSAAVCAGDRIIERQTEPFPTLPARSPSALPCLPPVELPDLSLSANRTIDYRRSALPLFPFHGIYIAALTRSSDTCRCCLPFCCRRRGCTGL